MTIEELGRMADEYAKEIAPDNKEAQTAISADSLGFLNKVMEKCCLVEKEAAEAVYNQTWNSWYHTLDVETKGKNQCVLDVLHYLFPEIAKEVEE